MIPHIQRTDLTAQCQHVSLIQKRIFKNHVTSGQDGGIVNMACILIQPEQKLQLNYKTTQNSQKIELTMEVWQPRN